MAEPNSEEANDLKTYHLAMSLYGGRLATLKVPVPLSKRNLERLQRMIADYLEPFVIDEEPTDG